MHVQDKMAVAVFLEMTANVAEEGVQKMRNYALVTKKNVQNVGRTIFVQNIQRKQKNRKTKLLSIVSLFAIVKIPTAVLQLKFALLTKMVSMDACQNPLVAMIHVHHR